MPNSLHKTIALRFLAGNEAFDFSSKKIIMQALRKFDEIGLAFDVWEALSDMKDFDYFFLYRSKEDLTKILKSITKLEIDL